MKNFIVAGAASLAIALTPLAQAIAMPVAATSAVASSVDGDAVQARYGDRGHHYGWGRGRGQNYGWSRGRHRGWR